jgi:hypothetical protein
MEALRDSRLSWIGLRSEDIEVPLLPYAHPSTLSPLPRIRPLIVTLTLVLTLTSPPLPPSAPPLHPHPDPLRSPRSAMARATACARARNVPWSGACTPPWPKATWW